MLLAVAAMIYGWVFAAFLESSAESVKFIYDFQTLIVGLLATAGVAVTLWFHRRQQQLSNEKEDRQQRQAMVASIHADVHRFHELAVINLEFLEEVRLDLLLGRVPNPSVLPLVLSAPEIRSIEYWAPRLGLLGPAGHVVIGFLGLRDQIAISLDRLQQRPQSQLWNTLIQAQRQLEVGRDRSNDIRSALAEVFPDYAYIGVG